MSNGNASKDVHPPLVVPAEYHVRVDDRKPQVADTIAIAIPGCKYASFGGADTLIATAPTLAAGDQTPRRRADRTGNHRVRFFRDALRNPRRVAAELRAAAVRARAEYENN